MSLLPLHIKPADLPLLPHEVEVSYQLFGQPLEANAPRVLVNHALTGNSQVAGESGWWKEIVGPDKVINTDYFTIIAINVVGNGFDGVKENLVHDYKSFSTKLVASIFWHVIDQLNIKELYAVIGGSIGGAIAWEMAFLQPNRIQRLIPIASTFQTSHWLEANAHVQEEILNTSSEPLQVARQHAMLLYRTPNDLKQKFNSQQINNLKSKSVSSWLDYHGKALLQRFELPAYQLMNHLLRTIGRDLDDQKLFDFAQSFKGQIHQIAIDTDLFFTADEQREQAEKLAKLGIKIEHQEIASIHGHDAFLIEYPQLILLLKKDFEL